MNKLEKESADWFKTELKKVTSSKAADIYDKGERRFVGNGSIVLFNYKNPKTPLHKLKFFDSSPLPIIIYIKNNYMLGLNLHWIPSKFRTVVIKFVMKQNLSRIKSNKKFELNFQPLKEFLKRNGLYEICIKKYLVNRITGLKYIKYSEWKYIVNLPLEKFVTDKEYTRADIDRLIMSHAKATRSAKNTRFGRTSK